MRSWGQWFMVGRALTYERRTQVACSETIDVSRNAMDPRMWGHIPFGVTFVPYGHRRRAHRTRNPYVLMIQRRFLASMLLTNLRHRNNACPVFELNVDDDRIQDRDLGLL